MKPTKKIQYKGTRDERTVWRNVHNLCHKEDGPAVIYKSGTKLWYLEGDLYTEDEYKKELYRRNLNKLNEVN